MNQNCLLPMESYRLAQYITQVPCYICGGGNTQDAELCRECQAPMALAHQMNSQGVRPQMIAAIGSAGAGKTVYLGMLADMLSRQHERLQLLARGAFSLTLQQTTIAALAKCEFPGKTPSEPDRWNWMHSQVRVAGQRQPTELIMPDMAGEAIMEEMDHPGSYPVIRAFLQKCTGAMLLIDTARLHHDGLEQDFFTMKILSYLSELDDTRKTGWKQRPLALVFSKADQCRWCFDDPTAFAKKYAPGLWQHCSERFKRFQFFAAGVAGATTYRREIGEARVRCPIRIEPRGIVEPFEWMIDQVTGK